MGDVPERHRLTTRTACSYLLAVLMLGGCATAGASDMSAPQAGPASATPSLTPHSNLSTYRSTRTHSETALPVRLRIPAIDVDTRLEQLGLAPRQEHRRATLTPASPDGGKAALGRGRWDRP